MLLLWVERDSFYLQLERRQYGDLSVPLLFQNGIALNAEWTSLKIGSYT